MLVFDEKVHGLHTVIKVLTGRFSKQYIINEIICELFFPIILKSVVQKVFMIFAFR